MKRFDYDLLVIGAGSGGVRAARIAASHGARVAICEHDRVGGTCVIRGCIPKKLLTYAAHFAEDFEDAAGFGWQVEAARFDWPALIAAKDREIDRLNGVYLSLLEKAGVRLFTGHGRLRDGHHAEVDGHTVSAGRILLATGSRPWVPEFSGREHVITSDEAFHLERQPGRVVTVGGGYIACEFSSIFNGLGSEVHQVYRGDVPLRGFDPEVRRALGREMAAKGVRFHFEARVEQVREAADGLEVHLAGGEIIAADCVLFATGRVPNSRGLGLLEAGVEVRADGSIVVDEYSRTNLPSVFAVGDITQRLNLTPVAIHEAHAFADTQFGDRPRSVDHAFVPTAVFTHPPVGTVGYTEDNAADVFGAVDVYRSEFRPLKHTLTGRDERTLMKLVVERSAERVVGVHVVGADAPEIVQGFAVAVKSGLTKDRFDATIGIHPTAAEELVTLRTPVQG